MKLTDQGNARTYYTTHASPIGELLLVSDGERLRGLFMEAHEGGPNERAGWQRDPGPFKNVAQQLDAYFAGERHEFTLPVHCAGTPFQQKVWQALSGIPHGETISYVELARRIGQPAASRAVGLANGRNPVSIIVPCHRVIGANGALTGYGGGIERKRWLLRHEAVALREDTLSIRTPTQTSFL